MCVMASVPWDLLVAWSREARRNSKNNSKTAAKVCDGQRAMGLARGLVQRGQKENQTDKVERKQEFRIDNAANVCDGQRAMGLARCLVQRGQKKL